MATLVFTTLVLVFYVSNSFSYENYSAQQAYSKGNFDAAQKVYKNQLVENSHDGHLLYNLGAASYRLQEFVQAQAYFMQSADSMSDKDSLKVRAYYNAGNAAVKNNDLQGSLELYQKALALDSGNERAQNNKKVVEDLLKQQQQKNSEQKKSCDSGKKNEKKQEENKEQDSQKQSDQQDGSGKSEENKQNNGKQDSKGEGSGSKKVAENPQPDSSQKKSGANSENNSEKGKNSADKGAQQEPSDGDAQDSSDLDMSSGKSDDKEGENKSSQQNDSSLGKQEIQRKSNDSKDNHKSKDNGSHDKERGQRADKQSQTQRDGDQQGGDKKNQHTSLSSKKDLQPNDANNQPGKKQDSGKPLHAEQVEESQEGKEKDQPEYSLMRYIESQEQAAAKRMFKAVIKQGMPEQHGRKNW